MEKKIGNSTDQITHTEVRMYRMGTGDCFVIKFFAVKQLQLTMMIDCGVIKGTAERVKPYMEDLLDYTSGKVDILVVTHEHEDHVSVFAKCKELFKTGLAVGEVWMGWTENDAIDEVKEWKTKYGQKKKAAAAAAKRLKKALKDDKHVAALKNLRGDGHFKAREHFQEVLQGLVDLETNPTQVINPRQPLGLLKGMAFVKDHWAKPSQRPQYLEPGNIFPLKQAPGVRVYVLGPPKNWDSVKKESGGGDGSYPHNLQLNGMDALVDALTFETGHPGLLPFEPNYLLGASPEAEQFYGESEAWRTIDYDWLQSAGQLALRANGLTNNLSLVLAIELPGQRVMLFPGDAEFGSWESWHKIDWKEYGKDRPKQPLTEYLLKHTVFYKVAHHLSHNGTAKNIGLELMGHEDLAAMATLDYSSLGDGWESTMPNREIVDELLKRTKGRLMVTRTDEIMLGPNKTEPFLADAIKEARLHMSEDQAKAFEENYKETDLYFQYKVLANPS